MNNSIETLYHHRGILVINKPHGLASQPTRENEQNVYNLLCTQHDYVGLHHRLDRPASGLLLLSTSKLLNKQIAESFARRTIQRGYLLWVLGKPERSGVWNQRIDGKEAVSRFHRVFTDNSQSLLVVGIDTGRKHQIRKHSAMAGFPILGDRRYGNTAGLLWDRLSLHAFKLSFTHPATGERVVVHSEVPKDLLSILGKERTRQLYHSLI